MLDAYKELTPVLYGENGVKIHKFDFYDPAMCFPAHWHDRIELLHVLSGTLEVYLDDEHVTAAPGQTVVIMPHMIHCGFSGEQGVSYHMIAFDIKNFCNTNSVFDKYLTAILNQKVRFCPIADNPAIAPVVEKLVAYSSMGNTCNPLCVIGKIYELLGLLYDYCTADSNQFRKTDDRFGAVLEYVNNHFTENISARDISSRFGYDETYFCRRFKEATGITTMKYIRILRLEMAQKLLRNGDAEIGTIAWQCGFADISYFSNCFKRHFGVTPTEFRNK